MHDLRQVSETTVVNTRNATLSRRRGTVNRYEVNCEYICSQIIQKKKERKVALRPPPKLKKTSINPSARKVMKHSSVIYQKA